MPRLTIIIPALGMDATFEDTLASVLRHRPADAQVMVVHREAYSDPYELSGEVDFLHAPQAATLSELCNLAVGEADARLVHVLRCGVLAGDDAWCEAPLRMLEDADIAAVSPLLLRADGRTVEASGVRYLAGGGRRLCDRGKSAGKPFRLGRSIHGPTSMAGFYRRDAWLRWGGWSSQVGDELADVDFAATLAAAGLQTKCARESSLRLSLPLPQPPRLTYAGGRSWEKLHRRHAAQWGWSSILGYPWNGLLNLRPGAGESWLGLPAHLIGRLAGRLGARGPVGEPLAAASGESALRRAA